MRTPIIARLLGACVLLSCQPALAFKLSTHIWLADFVAHEITTSGTVTLRTQSGEPFATYPVAPQVRKSISAHLPAFLMGVLGADVYPDLIAGQMTTHPGLPLELSKTDPRPSAVTTLSNRLGLPLNDSALGWQTDDWLLHVRSAAYARAGNKPSPELAFAYGYLLHAAMDTWAHSYVNLYSGDLFSIAVNQTIAARHTGLETFINKAHAPFQASPKLRPPSQSRAARTLIEIGTGTRSPLPPGSDSYSKLAAPTRFVRQTLLLNDLAAEQYSREPGAMHIWGMWAWWKTAQAVRQEAQQVKGSFDGALSQVLAQVDAAELAWQTLDTARQSLVTQTSNAYTVFQNAEQAVQDSAAELLAAKNSVLGHVSNYPPIAFALEQANGAISAILNMLPADLRNRYNRAVAAIPNADTAFRDAQTAYNTLKAQRDAKVGEVAAALTHLNTKKQLRNGLQQLHNGAWKQLDRSLRSWRVSIEAAVDAYVLAFEETAREIMRPHGNRYRNGGDPAWPLQAWATCWGPAFGLPTPGQLHANCSEGLTAVTQSRAQLGTLLTNTWTPDFIKAPITQLDERINNAIATALPDIAALVRLAVPNDSATVIPGSAAFAARLWDSDVSAADLDQIYQRDASELGLPTYSAGEIVQRLVADGLPATAVARLAQGKAGNASLSAMRNFTPVHNAIALSQLTFLTGSQLNALAQLKTGAAGSRSNRRRIRTYPPAAPAGAVLIGAIRSIDGNHQWQPVAPALLRAAPGRARNAKSAPYATEQGCRRFGYPVGNRYPVPTDLRGCESFERYEIVNPQLQAAELPTKRGLLLWQDQTLRAKVFNCVFKGPLSQGQCDRLGSNAPAGLGCSGEPYPDAMAATNAVANSAAACQPAAPRPGLRRKPAPAAKLKVPSAPAPRARQ